MPRAYKKNPESLRQKIEDFLETKGGHTGAEIQGAFSDRTPGGVSSTLYALHDAGVIFVEMWVFDDGKAKKYPRPVWNHVKNSPTQPPADKPRPTPPNNSMRLKKKREAKAGATFATRYLFKLNKRKPKP